MPKIKRKMVKRRKRGRKKTKVTQSLFENKPVIELHYADEYSLDGAAVGPPAALWIGANDIFGPDFNNVGLNSHQPLGYDEYALLYNTYRVLKSKIKVTPVFDSNTAVSPGYFGVYLDTDTTLSYTLGSAIIEAQSTPRRDRKWSMHNGIQTVAYGNYDGSLTIEFDAKKDLSPEGYSNAIPIGSRPVAETNFRRFFCVWASSIQANNPGLLDFLIEVTYTVELTDKKFLLQS